ncbi:MAG: homoserine O-acetyltransferase [Candidatus Diapherotrites archaeon]|nr:homoserine O-acetyltransferase [Candidatus Diapherotrites archaeon]
MQAITQFIEIPELKLCSGKSLKDIKVAFESLGNLSPEKDNAVLVFHALSGSAHISGENNEFGKHCKYWISENHVGWWNDFVGNSLLVDSGKNFVVCMNILGGCYGTTGPGSIDKKTGRPFASNFPEIEVEDMARLQKLVLEKLGIERLKAVIGSSLGGYLALEFAMLFGDSVQKVVLIGSAAKTSNLNTLHNLEQIFAIENDPNYNKGEYYEGKHPDNGLMLARMIAVKTYLDIDTIAERARSETVSPSDYVYNYNLSTPVESYMFHQAKKFVKRFDANSYLAITKAIQKFNLFQKYGNGSLENAFSKLSKQLQFLVVSIDSDVCFFTEEQEALFNALQANNIECEFELVHSNKGHDSFLLEPEKYSFLKEFLERECKAIEEIKAKAQVQLE